MYRSVSDWMRREVLVAHPDMLITDLTRALVEHKVTGAPVIDAEGHLVGIISLVDVAVALAFPQEGRVEPLSVSDVMVTQVAQVPPTASLGQALRELRRNRVHRVVVTAGQRVVGLLTPTDLLDAMLEQNYLNAPPVPLGSGEAAPA